MREAAHARDALRLISEGAELDLADEQTGWTPLMSASADEALDSVARRLAAAGAELDLVDRFGSSALILACAHGRAATALALEAMGNAGCATCAGSGTAPPGAWP